jgi:hypothetical protein
VLIEARQKEMHFREFLATIKRAAQKFVVFRKLFVVQFKRKQTESPERKQSGAPVFSQK